MKKEKTIGALLIIGAIGVLVPYTILTIIFNYPDILREAPGKILTAFHHGGSNLIFTWLAFALLGLPLMVAYSTIGKKLETRLPFVRWITTIGIISGAVQIIGLLRWVFVVPVLADHYVTATSAASQESITMIFTAFHQFAGVLLGEHLGQLFTVTWTIGISYALLKLHFIPKWMAWFGFIASAIYFLAQAELLATVIPGFPVWGMAGFIGSTLWLVWLVLVGVRFLRKDIDTAA